MQWQNQFYACTWKNGRTHLASKERKEQNGIQQKRYRGPQGSQRSRGEKGAQASLQQKISIQNQDISDYEQKTYTYCINISTNAFQGGNDYWP
jgi:hypothetical protein